MTIASDSSTTGAPATPTDTVANRLQKLASSIEAKRGSDVNAAIPPLEYTPSGRRYFDSVPIPLKRLFASPLAMVGSYAQGPKKERLVSSGWGDPRSTAYDKNINTSTFHNALDFPGPIGESVLAAADGKVTFVGYQAVGSPQAVNVAGVHANNAAMQILDGNGNVVASLADKNIGFGGICVRITHNADFEGYRTEYFHLSNTFVKLGQTVAEGQKIGAVGTSGGPYHWFPKNLGAHLHFQVSLVGNGQEALVRPTYMVPNYWPGPGHTDSTSIATNTSVAPPTPVLGSAPVGSQVMANSAQTQTQGSDRANIAQNKSPADHKQDQSDFVAAMNGRISAVTHALYAAQNSFSATGTTVSSAMSFNFETGLWSTDGKPV